MLRTADLGLADLLTSSHQVGVKVDVWLGADLLAENLPVTDGSLGESSDQQVQESLSLTIASMGPDGISYDPKGARGRDAVIGSDGHQLHVKYVIDRGNGSVFTCTLGRYRINDWNLDGGEITIDATGLLSIINDYQLLAPTSPSGSAKYSTETIRLVEGLLPVHVTASNDRLTGTAFAWTQDRIGALYDLADAWPADLRVDATGTLLVSDIPDCFVGVILLIEGEGGTVVETGDGGTRDGITNVIVASGEDSGDPSRTPVTGIASDVDLSSPTNVTDFGPVVQFYSSPLLTTTAAATKAAQTLLTKSLAMASAIPVSIIPDPRITFGTYIELHRQDGRVQNTIVTSLTLPLTAVGGQQDLVLGLVT